MISNFIGLLLVAFSFVGAGALCAQSYPSKPVRILASEPGAQVDFTLRLITPQLSVALGQTVIVDNRSSGGFVLPEIGMKAAPDGYTLLMQSASFWIATLMQRAPYDPLKNFAPVTIATNAPLFLFTHPSLPAKSVKELVALAKAKPGALSYSTGGSGTNLHIAAELFALQAGVKLLHIPYKGGGPALASVIAGEAALSFPSLGAALPQVNAGRLRAIAITSTQRSTLLPKVPTIAESGYPDYAFTSWVGVLAPAGTPSEIVAALNAHIVKAMRNPAVIERLAADGNEVVAGSPEQFAALIKTELARWAKVVRASGMKPE